MQETMVTYGTRSRSYRRAVRGVWVACAALALCFAAEPARAAAVIPTQWIAKQYTELLGRAPTPSEWSRRVSFYQSAATCDAASLAALGKELARSSAFLDAYPAASSLDKSLRLTALVRAAFNHDPNTNDWNAYFVPYLNGSATWDQTVDALYGGVFATFVAPQACASGAASYGWGYSPPLDVRQMTGQPPSRTQAQLQAAIDQAGSGSTVLLQPGEVIRVGGATNGNQGLRVKAGVTLRTSGAPTLAAYARMGRIVPAGPDGWVCVSFLCNQVGIVNLDAGAKLASAWVDGQGAGSINYKQANVDVVGSTVAAPSSVTDSRISNPVRDGTGIRVRGYATSGNACAGAVVQRNLVTGYGSAHRFDRLALPEWVDGIAIQCEQASVLDNEIVDASDTGILIYGAFNRAANAGAVQRSVVQGNKVLSAGLSAHVALGADAIGDSIGDRDNFVVPALDLPLERSFAGARIASNTFWTGPRTHFDIGIMAGGAPRWGDHRVFGRGLAVTNNTVGGASARVNIGISVLGMNGVTLSGNTAAYTLVDTMPASTFGKCPLVNVGVGSTERSSLSTGAQASVVHDGADGCLTPEGPSEGLERIAPASDGSGFVGAVTGKRIAFWGTGAAVPLFGDWNEVVENVRELRRMGYNSIRVLIQAEDFLAPPSSPAQPPTVRADALQRLANLFRLTEQTGIYVDLTGLGIETTADTDSWYDVLDEAGRWQAQAIFWRGVAGVVKSSPALAFYDLMNEPAIPSADTGTYCLGRFGGFCFTQNITKTPRGRTSATIARQWLTQMVGAIRQDAGDTAHMISIGTIFCGGGFELPATQGLIDFQIVHLYPRDDDPSTPNVNELQKDISSVKACKKPGFPLVVEETAMLAGSDLAVEAFVRGAMPESNGFFAQSNGMTPSELNPPETFPEAFQLGTYRVFLFNAFRANPGGTGAIQP